MTLEDTLQRIEYMKQRTAAIRDHEGCTEVRWRIEDLEPDQIIELQEPLNAEWFRCGNTMAIMLFNPAQGWHILLSSVPVEIRQQFEYIKQSV